MLLEFAEKVEPYPFGHGHPRFYGWVNGPPAPIGVFADALDEPRNVRAPVTKNVWFRAPPRTLFARADDRVAGGIAIAARG